MNLKLIISFIAFIEFACKEPNIKFINSATYPNLKEERLGQSSYYLKFPSTMFLEEARGKEGQLGYGLWLIDSINRYIGSNGFIELEEGISIGEDGSKIHPFSEVARSDLLGGTAKWRINSEGGYFYAVTNHGKLTLTATSLSHVGLDSIIAIISTLSSR